MSAFKHLERRHEEWNCSEQKVDHSNPMEGVYVFFFSGDLK